MAAITALQGLRDKGQIQPGQKVLIYGASGGVGTFALQIAKSFGAEVTAVCSTRNLDQSHSLGADHVIDYTREEFTRNGQLYDLILAVNGYRSIFDFRRSLCPQGIFILAGVTSAHFVPGLFQSIVLGPMLSKNGGQKLAFMGIADINQADLNFLKELLENGKVVSLIEERYPLEKTGEALGYLAEGHARSKIVITV